jgi:prepilin-type N-terminal cleavage/methylation domain-containing protein
MRRSRGFTLVELMVTVVIIAVLSVVAGMAYTKYFARARTSEVTSMFGEIRNREEAYRAEFSTYVTTSTNASNAELDFYPSYAAMTSGGTPDGEPAPKAFTPPTTGNYSNFYNLGVHPGKTTVYCVYAVTAGTSGSWGTLGTVGQSYFTAQPTEPWWIATAMCDSDGKPGAWSTSPGGANAQYITWYNNVTIRAENEGR